jgi:hypothetical protein
MRALYLLNDMTTRLSWMPHSNRTDNTSQVAQRQCDLGDPVVHQDLSGTGNINPGNLLPLRTRPLDVHPSKDVKIQCLDEIQVSPINNLGQVVRN